MHKAGGRRTGAPIRITLILVAAIIPAVLFSPLPHAGRSAWQAADGSRPEFAPALSSARMAATPDLAIPPSTDRVNDPVTRPAALPSGGPAPLAPSDPSAGLPQYSSGGRPSTGTSFAYEAPDRFLRVTSATPVRLSLLADAVGVMMTVEQDSGAAPRTDLAIEGLQPRGSYRLIEDGLVTALLAADDAGGAAFGLDLSAPHVVQIQQIGPVDEDGSDTAILLYDGDTFNFTGSMADTYITVLGDDVTISGNGFTLAGNGTGIGIESTGHSNLTIKNLTVDSFARGLSLTSATGVNLTGVTFSKSGFGIVDVGWSAGLLLDSCQFSSNVRGLHLVNTASVVQTASGFNDNTFPFEFYAAASSSPSFELHSCTFTHNTYPPTARANSPGDYAGFSWDSSNFTDGLPDFCFFNLDGSTTPIDSINNATNFMFLGGCSNYTITNVTMTTGDGKVLMLDLCFQVDISGCTMTGVAYGILSDRSSEVSVSSCSISNFKVGGVTFVGGGAGPMGGTIAGNTFSSIYGGPGIGIVNFKVGAAAEGVSVTGNTLSALKGWGILLSNASGNDLGSNTLTATGGIRVEGDSAGNAFHHNTIQTSQWTGMNLAAGLLGALPSGNRIIGNSFLNNASPAWDDGYSIWDDREGSGNYWSGWSGPDTGLPLGVVDAPYLPPHGPSLNPDPQDSFPRTAAFPAAINPYSTTPCAAAADQFFPLITPDGAGGAIIAWNDFRAGGWDVYAQRLNATGVPQWNAAGVAICVAANDQYVAAIVTDGAGGAVIVWTDERNFFDGDIYAQRVDSTGKTKWTDDGEVVCKVAGAQYAALAIPDEAGGAIVAWQDDRSMTTSDIYAQRISVSGAALWKAGGTEICTVGGDQQTPQICATGSGGAVIVWTDNRGGPIDLYGQRVDALGAVEWAANGAPVSSTGNGHYGPRIVTDGAGGAIVTWQDEGFVSFHYDIYAQRIDATGVTLWGDTDLPVCSSGGFEYGQQLASDHAGGAIFVWEDDRNGGSDIYAQRIDSHGAAMWADDGVAICLNASTQTVPQICWDGWGGAVIAWTDLRGAGGDIYAQRVNGSGQALWAPDGAAICGAAGGQDSVCLASDGLGRAVIAWQDDRNGNWDIFARSVYARGNK